MLAAFAGIYYFNATPNVEVAERMLKRIPLPDHLTVSAKAIGQAAIATALPHSEVASFEVNCRNHIFAASGSVYNKQDIMNRAAFEESDSELGFMKNTWLQFGRESVSLMNGDWMFAAYYAQNQELLLARSWGYSSLYLYREKEFVAFATHLMAFKAVVQELKPDVDTLFKGLCSQVTAKDSTGIEGVRQLPLATCLKISGQTVTEYAWWQPPKRRRSLSKHLKKMPEDQIIKNFYDVFQKAVAQRIDTNKNVAATLSAGLDSSAVCAVSAAVLKEQGRNLTAYTSIPHYTDEACGPYNRLSDERRLATLTAEYIENIQHELVDASEENPIASIKNQVYLTGKPLFAPGNWYWIEAALHKANALDCGTLMIGQCGNSTISWTPRILPFYAKSKYFPNTPWRKYLSITFKRARYSFLRNFNFKARMRQRKFWLKAYAIHPDYPFTQANKRVIQYQNPLEGHMAVLDLWYHNSLHSGIEVRDPTMDQKLIDFLYQLPDYFFYRDGIDRRMVRIALKELLPYEVCFNRKRGQQASDLVPRIREFAKDAQEAIDKIEQCEWARKLLDIGAMRKVLARIQNGETGQDVFIDCNALLLRGIAAGFFLTMLDEK